MQLINYFDSFLNEKVNLSQAKLDELDQRVKTVYNVLKSDEEVGKYITGFTPQGSWAHRTIINPQRNIEFDADLLLEMSENPDWINNPKAYVDGVYRALHRHKQYSQMPHMRKCRCVRLVYANDMHIDIVPHLYLPDGREVIVNRDNNRWEITDPTGFTQWMKDKDSLANGNLRKVIRLMKYLRDHKGSFTGTPSIILTTLLGERVSEINSLLDTGTYRNVPTALSNILTDLDTWLQARPGKPSVVDPSSSGATFDHRWGEESYSYFRDRIHTHARQVQQAYEEPDRDRSIKLWQELFGAGFKAPSVNSTPGKFSSSTTPSTLHRRSGRAG